MGWIVLNNAARVGANYASLYAPAWNGGVNASTRQDAYEQLVAGARREAAGVFAGCDDEVVPSPAFPSGYEIGDYAVVELDCGFQPITPLIGEILSSGGGTLPVGAKAVFPIRTGKIDSPPEDPAGLCRSTFTYQAEAEDPHAVQFTNTTAGGSGIFAWDFGDAEYEVVENPLHIYEEGRAYSVTFQAGGCTSITYPVLVLDEAPEDPPPPGDTRCQVPVFADTLNTGAIALWSDAGFTGTITYIPAVGEWTVASQTLVGNSLQACDEDITLRKK